MLTRGVPSLVKWHNFVHIKKGNSMDERALLSLWNENRMQIIIAQIAPALVLIAVFVLSAQGTFADASDPARYLAIAVANKLLGSWP